MAREQAPIDTLTGTPLLLAPRPNLLQHLKGPRTTGGLLVNRNHPHFPARHSLLTSTDGKAVRESRVQVVLCTEHGDFHDMYDGPPLPASGATRLRTIAFNLAGYIPPLVIEVKRPNDPIVQPSAAESYALRSEGVVRVAQSKQIKSFLERHIFRCPEPLDIGPELTDQLLRLHQDSSAERKRRAEVTRQVFWRMIAPIAAPLESVYRQSLESERLHPDAPSSMQQLLYDQFINPIHSEDTLVQRSDLKALGEKIYDRFAAHREIIPEPAVA